MQRLEKLEKWIVYIAAMLLCLVLASFWMMCNLYARYTTEASGEDGARVAIFGHNQSITLSDEAGLINLMPGNSVDYTLVVANYNASKVSEVALKYDLEIITAGNLPLNYTVSKKVSSSNTDVSNVIGTFAESAQNKTAQFENEQMYFKAGIKEESIYTISVQWPQQENDEKYAGIPDEITVSINVEQID